MAPTIMRAVKAGSLRSCLARTNLASQNSQQYSKPGDGFYHREEAALMNCFRHASKTWHKLKFYSTQLHLEVAGTLLGNFLVNNGLAVPQPGLILGNFPASFQLVPLPPNVPLNAAQSPLPGALYQGRPDANLCETDYWNRIYQRFEQPVNRGPHGLLRDAFRWHRSNVLRINNTYFENFNELIRPKQNRKWHDFFNSQAHIQVGEVNLYYATHLQSALAQTIRALGDRHLTGIPGINADQRRALVARTIAVFRPYFVHMVPQMNAQHPLFLPQHPANVVNLWIGVIAPIYNLLVYILHPAVIPARVAAIALNVPLQPVYPNQAAVDAAGRGFDKWENVIGDATLGNRAAPCLYYLSRLHRSTHEALDAARGAPGHWQPIEWAQLPDRHRIPFAHYDNRSLVNLIVKPSMAQALWPNQRERFCAVEARKWQLPLSAAQPGIFEPVRVKLPDQTGSERVDFWKMRCLLYRLFGDFFDGIGNKISRFKTPHFYRFDNVDVDVGRMSIQTDGHSLHINFSLDPGPQFTAQRARFLMQHRVPTGKEIRSLPIHQNLPPATCTYKTTYSIKRGVVANSLMTAQGQDVSVDLGFDQHMVSVRSGAIEAFRTLILAVNNLKQQLQNNPLGAAQIQAAIRAAYRRFRVRKEDFVRSIRGRQSRQLNYSRAFEQSEEARRRNNHEQAQLNINNGVALVQTSIDDRIQDMRGKLKRHWGIDPARQRAGMKIAASHRKYLSNFVNRSNRARRFRLTASASRESATMREAQYCAFDIGKIELERKGFKAKLSKCKKERRHIKKAIRRRAARRDAHLVAAGRAPQYSPPAARHKIVSIGPGIKKNPKFYGSVKTSAMIQYFTREYSVVVLPERGTSDVDPMSLASLPTGGRGIQVNAANQPIGVILPPLPVPPALPAPPTYMARFQKETHQCPVHIPTKEDMARVHHLPGGSGSHRRQTFCTVGPTGPLLTRNNVIRRSTHQQHHGWRRLYRQRGVVTPIQQPNGPPQPLLPGLPADIRMAPAAAQAGPVGPLVALAHRDVVGALNIQHVSLHHRHYGSRPAWNVNNDARDVGPAQRQAWQAPVGWQSHVR